MGPIDESFNEDTPLRNNFHDLSKGVRPPNIEDKSDGSKEHEAVDIIKETRSDLDTSGFMSGTSKNRIRKTPLFSKDSQSNVYELK